MRMDTWNVNVYVKYTPVKDGVINLTVETAGKNLASAINSAKSKVIANCKKTGTKFMRVALLDYTYMGYEERNIYDVFVNLKNKKMNSKSIMRIMKMTYSEFLFFNNYYEGRTKKLTYQKYFYLKQFMKDEQIRKKFKIPKSEFLNFVESNDANNG